MRSLFSGFVFGGASGSVVGQSIDYVQTSVTSWDLHLNAMSVELSIIRAKEPRLLRPELAPLGSFGRNC